MSLKRWNGWEIESAGKFDLQLGLREKNQPGIHALTKPAQLGHVQRWPSRALGFLIGLLLMGGNMAAQQIDVCVNFAGSGIPAAAQPVFLAKVQAHFTGAGLGPGNFQRVILHNSAAPPAGGCDLTANFAIALAGWLGISNKRGHNCAVNRLLLFLKFPGAANSARRCQATADVMAHEIGHLLAPCAIVH